jgi:hypothetical protein
LKISHALFIQGGLRSGYIIFAWNGECKTNVISEEKINAGVLMLIKIIFPSILLLVLIVSCSPISPRSNPEENEKTPAILITSTPGQSFPTAFITATPHIARTATPAVRPTQKPTTSPSPSETRSLLWGSEVQWSGVVSPSIAISDFIGDWATGSNEIWGVEKFSDDVGALAVADAPEFVPKSIDIGGGNILATTVTWSLDGKKVFFGGPREGYPAEENEDIWSIDTDRQNPYHFTSEAASGVRFLEFLGWLDDTELAYQNYSGGGHEDIYILDTKHDKAWNVGLIHGIAYKPFQKYIPASYCDGYGTCYLLVLTKDIDPQGGFKWMDSGEHARVFPNHRLENWAKYGFYFQDWMPNQQKILAAGSEFAQIESTSIPVKSGLYLWDLVTNKVSMVAPGGIIGDYSPDGKHLAYVTLGPALEYQLIDEPGAQEPVAVSGDDPFLQLKELKSGKDMFSLPIQSDLDWTTLVFDYRPRFAFSPDGRYLAFISPAQLIVDEKNLITSFDKNQESDALYLHLIDLETYTRLTSIPGVDGNSELAWSGDGRALVFQDVGANWQVVATQDGSLIPLTKSAGDELFDPSWSSDGSYLKFSKRTQTSEYSIRRFRTYIFSTSDLIGR